MLTTNQLPRGSSNETSNISTSYGTPSEGQTRQLRGRSVIVKNLHSAAALTSLVGISLLAISTFVSVFVSKDKVKFRNSLEVISDVGLYTMSASIFIVGFRICIMPCTLSSQSTNTSDYQELA